MIRIWFNGHRPTALPVTVWNEWQKSAHISLNIPPLPPWLCMTTVSMYAARTNLIHWGITMRSIQCCHSVIKKNPRIYLEKTQKIILTLLGYNHERYPVLPLCYEEKPQFTLKITQKIILKSRHTKCFLKSQNQT